MTPGKDVSLAGYGNARNIGSGITSIDKGFDESGVTAVKMLLQAINNPEQGVKNVKIPTTLFIANTTGRRKS